VNDILSLMRPDLQGFAGYSSAAGEATGSLPSVKADANESPWPPFGSVAALCPVNRYAEPQPLAIRDRMAAMWGVPRDSILLTSGSSQAIDLLIRLFCTAGRDQIMICPPTFSMYEVYAQIQGAGVVAVALGPDGQLDLPAIDRAVSETTKVIFIPTPNAPMGHAMRRDDLLALCKSRAGKSIVVADEAYAEFSSAPQGMLGDLASTPNLVILRTLSKAYALAGERVGCLIGPEALVRVLRGLVPPYPLAQSAVRAAMDVLSANGLAQTQTRLQQIVAERTRLSAALANAPDVLRVYPSEGNFILLQTRDAAAFLDRLGRFDIVARNMSRQRPETVRLSVGSEAENDLVLKALGIETKRERTPSRLFSLQRETRETAIDVTVNLDEPMPRLISTGLGFFDHMLDQLAAHGGFGLVLQAKGDLDVDAHHTIEDCALALGSALRGALGDKSGIERFGFTAPLDESVAAIVLDLSGRPFFDMKAAWPTPCGDGMSPDLVAHFFRSLATNLNATLHVDVRGDNAHHMTEACFKALGRALRQALRREGSALPSTKGVL